jgi:O-antigen ligase
VLIPAVVLVAAFLLLLLVYGYTPFASHRIAGGFMGDLRFKFWPILWGIYEKHPLLGYGWGAFGVAMFKTGQDIFDTGGFQLVDSFYLLLLLNTGLVGTFLFFIFLSVLFRSSLRVLRYRQDQVLRSVGICLDGSLLAYLAYIIGTNYLEGVPTNIYFWLLVGMKISLDKLMRTQQGVKYSSSNTSIAAAEANWGLVAVPDRKC